MTDIETYAVGLVGSGALSYAEDDMDEDNEFPNRREDWKTARSMGVKMALAVQRNPESFLRWYRETTLAEAIR
ncbi:MAG: hypothetical protein ABW022_14760 [Actinoplanes sp.]